MVPTAVLTRSKLVFNTAVRPISAVVPKIMVTRPRLAHPIAPVVSTTQGIQGKWDNPQYALKDKGVINSGCSWHITRNMSYLSKFKELNGRYVAFGGNPKGGKISSKGKIKTSKLDFDDVYFVKELKFNLFSVSQMCDKKNSVLFTDTECLVLSPDFKLPDESQVLLRGPRENNMYNVNLKNIVPSGDLTCLFAKATIDESNLWHRRLGHINFKTINKLMHMIKSGKIKELCMVKQRSRAGSYWNHVPESEVIPSPSSSAQSRKQDDKTKKEAKGKSPVKSLTGYRDLSAKFQDCSGNSSNEINTAELEDITYSDDENVVGAKDNFNNLENSITVSPIPTTRIHKDHHKEPKRVHHALKDPR
nr:ribonuclease H-like domain-containing protein [Tanacetum cinerariifolium]